MRAGRVSAIGILILGLSTSGCLVAELASSVSTSVSQVSKTVSNGARSLSESSSPDSMSANYAFRSDVRVYTRAVAFRGGDTEFVRSVGNIALRHGINHWESEPGTLHAIGAGLREAGLDEAEVDRFLGAVGRDAAADRERVLLGYRTPAL